MKNKKPQAEAKSKSGLVCTDLLGIWLLKTKLGDIVKWKQGGLSKVCSTQIKNADWKLADPEKPWVVAHVTGSKPHHLWIQTEDGDGNLKSLRHDEIESWWSKMPNS